MSKASAKKSNETFARTLEKRRKARGLSLGALAKEAGISKSNLSRLEAGDGNPSLETLWSLSNALGIAVRDLIEPVESSTRVQSARGDTTVGSEQSNFSVGLLSSSPIGATRDIYRASFEPGDPKISEPHGPGVVEHIILLSGRAKVGPVEKPEILTPGDYVVFSGNQQHIYEALKNGTTAIVIMEQF